MSIWAVLGFLALAGTGLCSLPSNERPATGDDNALKRFLMKNNRLPYPNETVSEGDQPGLKSWTTCEGCKLLISEAAKLMKNPQEIAELKKLLERVCQLPILSGHKAECDNMVNNIVTVIHQLEPILDNPTAVCEELKYCPESIRGEVTVKQRLLLLAGLKLMKELRPPHRQTATEQSVPCDECIFAISELKTLLQSQSIQADLKQEIRGLCRIAGQYKSECEAMVDQYFDLMVQELEQVLSNGRQVCVDIGLCSSVTSNTDSGSSTVVRIRPVHTRVGRVHLHHRSDVSIATPKMTLFASTFRRLQTSQGINAGCLVCQSAFKAGIDELRKEKTAEAVTGEVTTFVCGLIPKDMKVGCTDFMNIYSRALLQLVVTEYTPAQICTAIHLCKDDEVTQIDALTGTEKSATECEACQVVSQYISFEFQQPDFQMEAVNVLKRLCTMLPGDYANQVRCESYVETYAPYIMENSLALTIPRLCLVSVLIVFMFQCGNSVDSYVPAAFRYAADYLSRDVLCSTLGMC